MVTQAQSRRLIHGPRLGQWWALQLQKRRRARLSASVSVPPMLDSGLLQFYRAQDGVKVVRSFNETVAVPAEPFAGMASYTALDDSGNYAAGDVVRYYLAPYVTVDGGRVYLGVTTYHVVNVVLADSGIERQEWTSTPTGVDGFTVVRWLNTTTFSHRHLTTASMAAGGVDTGTGWTAGLPWSFETPMVSAKAMWSRFNHWLPAAMVTEASPLGGVAFDTSTGYQWVRECGDDVARLTDCTTAFWFCPTGVSGIPWSVRGITQVMFSGGIEGDEEIPAEITIGGNGEIAITDHVPGDWYLIVNRNDTLEGLQKLTAYRLRDSARFDGATDAMGTSLTTGSDYFLEGMLAAVSLGSSWHWNVQGYGYFDRLGIWDRALTSEEIEGLFNFGLGWEPGD